MSHLRTRDLTIVYGSGRAAHTALHPLDLELPEGQRVALIGRSGGGKTTLARALTGHLLPSQGQVLLDGRPPREHGGAQLLPQDPLLLLPRGVPLDLLVEETLLAHRRSAPGLTPLALLARVGLADRATALPEQLSGGERRRAALARILATAPQLVVADEITSGLDAHLGPRMVQVLFDQLGPQCTIVLVTHDLPLARATCDRLLVLDGGRLVDDLRRGADPASPHPATSALFAAAGWPGGVR
jgi:ABC-type dipeptide/oligopeptide/nickel transport system ATPase subunit